MLVRMRPPSASHSGVKYHVSVPFANGENDIDCSLSTFFEQCISKAASTST